MWNRAVVAVVIGALIGPTFGQVRSENVLPATTDPAINAWLSAHAAAIVPGSATRNQLFLYLHGQGGTGTGAMELVRTAAEEGLHAVGLTYPNDWSPFNVCASDPACPENLRREIIDGTDRTTLIAVSRANSIENRLIKLLAWLDAAHPGEGWGQFVSAGTINWGSIVVWGHSQGGGNAGVIGKHHALARLCTSAPAADGGPGNPAAWWGAPFATPAAVSYGFCHAQDALNVKVAFWNALGMGSLGAVTDVAVTASPFGGTHELSSSVAPAITGQYHNSVVADAVTPRNGDGTPTYKPVWRYMMTGGAGTSGAPSRDDQVFATVPTETGTTDLMMDIFGATAGTGPRPVAVWIHGGGWQSGTHNQMPAFALGLRARGITVVSIGYRLSGEAVFPAPMHDCKGAIRWLRAHAAELQIDPTRIGVWGSSAGGHLASLLATSAGDAELEGTTGGNAGQSSAVMACATLFGPTDILTMALDCEAQSVGCSIDHDAPSSGESKLLGVDGAGQGIGWLRVNIDNPAAPFPELAELARSVDPIRHLDATDPPLFIAHGDTDTTVPIGQSIKLRDGAKGTGVCWRFNVAPGFGHGFLGDTVNDAIVDWMGDVLLGEAICPRIVMQPVDARAAAGCAVSFSVLASGSGSLAFAWRKDGAVIDAGANPSAATATLVLANNSAASQGSYDCIVSNACGEVWSASATLTLCAADFNCSGVASVQDVFDFLAAYFGGDARADVNGSGGLSVQDIFDFLAAYFAGCS